MRPQIGDEVIFKFAESSAKPKMILQPCKVVRVLGDGENPDLDLIATRPDGSTYTCERVTYGNGRGTWSEKP